MDDIDLMIAAVVDTSEDILQRNEGNKETMYDRIEEDLKGVQQALYASHAVSTALSSSEGIEVGDEPTQLCILTNATEARLH
jgi:hypothetical protein